VARALGDIQAQRLAPDAAAAGALPIKLDEATTLLKQGRIDMGECDRLLADLVLRVGR
jgi:hypothetical protein